MGHPGPTSRAEQWEQRLAIPVLIAALVSVPAVFLTMTDGVPSGVGHVLNWASMTIIVGESLVLLLLSGDYLAWLRRHRWPLLVAAATVPAVVFAVGPVQILRLVLSIGAFRILRVGRILRAARMLRERAALSTRRAKISAWVLTAVAAVFVTAVLADPSSRSRQIATWTVERLGVGPAIFGGLLLAATTFLAVRYRRRREHDPPADNQ